MNHPISFVLHGARITHNEALTEATAQALEPEPGAVIPFKPGGRDPVTGLDMNAQQNAIAWAKQRMIEQNNAEAERLREEREERRKNKNKTPPTEGT